MLAPVRRYPTGRVSGGCATVCRATACRCPLGRRFTWHAELVDLVGTALTGVTDAAVELSECPLLSCRRIKAPPPMASTTGHSSEASDTERAQRQCGCRRGMTTAADAALHTGGRAGHGADNAVDRGAADRTCGLGGYLRGTPHCSITLRTAPLTTPMMTP